MTILYRHPDFLEHDTGRNHPERAERLRQVERHLERTGLIERCRQVLWRPVEDADLFRVHDPHYVNRLAEYCRQGGGRIEADTVVSSRSYDVARLAAGSVCDAVERIIKGEDTQAMCLVRPPGHHALTDAVMGFCLFNNVAVAARMAAQRLDLNQILIIDWDVHHGNGTQDSFWTDPQVGYLSIHRWPFYPGTGDADETGSGSGLGSTFNLPIEMGTPRREYIDRFQSAVDAFATKLRPELVIISAGFDSHRDDPIGSLGLETEDFVPLTQMVLDVAQEYSNGRVISVLEGGYNTGILAGCVELHLNEMLDRQAAEQR